ncbi:hypothetical protein GGD81_003051 [Rhodobium orientis]|uniref:DUF4386 domain-containing protein n=1 Tax=Rhodobium orientis TaxID=34017 RepID=A0A327JVL6_9HYPH|nr:hypothetical protein [Rhodobium orientis]MBB4303996.1 hypothetical protein [Rhodobium orientis]MBK5950794.1 hypothetical protein [Rhodobium orientis]RAI29635.1 hypothetical protein CH339_02500 [Rhodobium orientis]
MGEFDKALTDIANIRSQLAAGTLFRGFGPAVIAVTGGLALVAAVAQSAWPAVLADGPVRFVLCWIAVAVVAVALVGVEMLARSRRLHGGMADAMILAAVEQFLPAGVAGAAVTAAVLKYAADAVWILPGLWQILVALGLFASLRSLPRSIGLAGAWYLLAGIAVFILASGSRELSPWMMGVPFALGQGLMAVLLRTANGGDDGQPV